MGSTDARTLTRSVLIEQLQHSTGLPHSDAAELLESMLKLMTQSLLSGQNLKITGFGTFQIRQKARRMGRNPKTREPCWISPRAVLSFHPSAMLKAALNPVPKPRKAHHD
jgi:integration host factor subunit alpha